MLHTQFASDYQRPRIEPLTLTQSNVSDQPHGTDLIGRPIFFATGQFSGQTIRAQLREVQQADLGRKYARVDRRPLDPPPVVHLRLFHVINAGSDQEREEEIENYDEVQLLGLLCTVDLFPAPPQPGAARQSDVNLTNSSTIQNSQYSSPTTSKHSLERRRYTFTAVSPPTHPIPPESRVVLASSDCSPPPPIPGYFPASRSAPDIIHHIGDYPITETSKMTQALVGATFVQPSNFEFQGKKAIVFVFADLAVKVEGTFILRYRIFDIFSRPHRYNQTITIQAECYGGRFRVYSTKEFPGLQASTELTLQLARWGVRLNTRETERKRRKKGEARSMSPTYTGNRKRKLPAPENPDATYGSDDDRAISE